MLPSHGKGRRFEHFYAHWNIKSWAVLIPKYHLSKISTEVEGSIPSVPTRIIPFTGNEYEKPYWKDREVPEVSILEQIKKLVELQKIDAEIYEFKKGLKEKPALIEEFKERFEEQKTDLKGLEEKLKTLQLERKAKELDLQIKEQDIAKANTQLSQIKTNKEYTAKLTEIEYIKSDQSILEEKILISYEEIDRLTALIGKEKTVLVEEEKKFLAQKKEVEDTVKEIQQKVKVLETKRNQIVPDIDRITLARYERILVNKEGLAIVSIQGNACGGCYMNVPAQMINEIKMHDKIVYCEMCARMLYLEEDLK